MIATRALVAGIEPEALAALTNVLVPAGITVVFDDDNTPDLVFVGDLATARTLAGLVEPGRMALVVPFLDRHVEDAAFAMRVRPLVAGDAEEIMRFVHGHVVIDLDEPADSVAEAETEHDHWWHRHHRSAPV